jgi:hypothetical protein
MERGGGGFSVESGACCTTKTKDCERGAGQAKCRDHISGSGTEHKIEDKIDTRGLVQLDAIQHLGDFITDFLLIQEDFIT